MTAYYNEIGPYCAAWLQNLMDAGHIPAGYVGRLRAYGNAIVPQAAAEFIRAYACVPTAK